MAEEKKDQSKEKWLSWLALTTVVLAVAATLSTFRGGSYSTKSVLNEIKASNQWNYFQAKKIRGYLFDLQKETVENELKFRPPSSPEAEAEMKKGIEAYAKKITKWNADRDEIEARAKGYEKARDDALRHSQAFGMAVIFLQMAILLSSIAALMKRKPLWIVGLGLGVLGLVYFADGFLLFM